MKRLVLALCFLFPFSARAAPSLPPAFTAAQKTAADWLAHLKGKTMDQIQKELGPASEVGTWEHGTGHGAKWRYQITPGSYFDLLFYGDGRVIAISYVVLL